MSGIKLIEKERDRQRKAEGYVSSHDYGHDDGQLAATAACYAAPFQIYRMHRPNPSSKDWRDSIEFVDPWPFKCCADKRKKLGNGIRADFAATPTAITTEERIRELVKAGALCAAEIDRLQRASRRASV